MRERPWGRPARAAAAAAALAGALVATVPTRPASAASSPLGNEAVFALTPQTSPNWWFPIESAATFLDINSQVSSLLYLPLVNFSDQDTVSYQDAVADRITYNKSGTVYDIDLKPAMRWSDGRPVTSADVLFGWQVMDAASGSASKLPWQYGGADADGMPYDWKSVVAAGPHEVVVTIKSASNPQWFIHNDLSQLYPIPAFVWDKYPRNMIANLRLIQNVANSPTAPEFDVVDGPFKFSAMVPNEYWSFVPNPTFDGQRATISKLVMQYETSPEAEFAALKSGTVNVGYLPFSLYSARGELTDDTFRPAYVFGYNYIQPNELATSAQVHGAFKSLYVRQALQMGINQPGIIKAFYDGIGVPENSPVPSEPRTSYYDPHLKTLYPFDPAAGRRLLEAHGWRLEDGVMTKGAVALKFTLFYAAGSDTDTAIAQYLKSTWAQEGIDVTLEIQQANTIFTYGPTNPTKWAMVWWGTGWTYEPDYDPTGGELFSTGAAQNGQGYSNAHMNALINATYLPGSAGQIQSRMDAYLSFAGAQLPEIYMPYVPQFIEYADNVHGVLASFNTITDLYWPNQWRIGG